MRVSVVRIPPLVVTALVATLLGTVAIAAAMNTSFPGAPWLGDTGEPADVTVTSEDIEVKVIQVLSDETGLAIAVGVSGRPELGEDASTEIPPALVNSSGDTILARASFPDPNDWRIRTYVFNPVPDGFGLEARLVIESLSFYDRELLQQTGESPVFVVDSTWELPVSLESSASASRLDVDESIEIGQARFVVESATTSESGLVIAGRLEGIAPEDVPALNIEASLTDEEGDRQGSVLGRWGFGLHREQFEFRFPRTTSDSVVFEIALEIDANVPGVDAATLAQLAGESGSVEIDMPR